MMNRKLFLVTLSTAWLLTSGAATTFPEEPEPARLIGLATSSPGCAEQTLRGLQDILLGWDERAHAHFASAVGMDSGCAIAHWGYLLTDEKSPQPEMLLPLKKALQSGESMTPAETALLKTGLELLAGNRQSAAREFEQRSKKWRADILSACWATLLLHDGYDEAGQPLTGQKESLELIQQLSDRVGTTHPGSGIICYLRALLEETAPTVSEEALTSAKEAVSLLPQHPSPHLLLGHLLVRSGKVAESIPHFHRAYELALQSRVALQGGEKGGPYAWPLEIRARLYEATSLWMNGKPESSLRISQELNKYPLAQENLEQSGAILLHWEAHTLPLRLLVLQTQVPSDSQIKVATAAATLKLGIDNDPVACIRDCLRFCLLARQRAHLRKHVAAVKCIEAAERAYKKLLDHRETVGQGRALSSWTRACEACDISINIAKAATYSASTEIWEENSRRAARPTSLLMPPVIPVTTLPARSK